MIQGLYPPPSSHAWFLGIISRMVEEGRGGTLASPATRKGSQQKAGNWGKKTGRQGRGCDSLLLEWEAPLNIISASSLFFCSINNWLIPNDSILVKRKLHLGAVRSHLTCNLHLADCESVSL